jgi:hypothetical protein
MEAGTDLEIDIKVGNSDAKDAPKAKEKAVARIRSVFELKAPEGSGLEVGKTLGWFEVFELFDTFMLWADQLKKNSRAIPIPATGTLPNTESSLTGNQPSSNTSDSGSIVTEESTEKSNPCVSEQPLPSAS